MDPSILEELIINLDKEKDFLGGILLACQRLEKDLETHKGIKSVAIKAFFIEALKDNNFQWFKRLAIVYCLISDAIENIESNKIAKEIADTFGKYISDDYPNKLYKMIQIFNVKWFLSSNVDELKVFRILNKLSLILKRSYNARKVFVETVPNGGKLILCKSILESLLDNIPELSWKFILESFIDRNKRNGLERIDENSQFYLRELISLHELNSFIYLEQLVNINETISASSSLFLPTPSNSDSDEILFEFEVNNEKPETKMKEIIRSQIVLILNKENNYLKDILNVSQQVEKYLLNKKDEKSKDVNAIFTEFLRENDFQWFMRVLIVYCTVHESMGTFESNQISNDLSEKIKYFIQQDYISSLNHMISMFEVKWFKLFGIPEPVIFRILCKLSLVLKNSFMPKTTTQEEIIPNGNLYVMIRKILETLTNNFQDAAHQFILENFVDHSKSLNISLKRNISTFDDVVELPSSNQDQNLDLINTKRPKTVENSLSTKLSDKNDLFFVAEKSTTNTFTTNANTSPIKKIEKIRGTPNEIEKEKAKSSTGDKKLRDLKSSLRRDYPNLQQKEIRIDFSRVSYIKNLDLRPFQSYACLISLILTKSSIRSLPPISNNLPNLERINLQYNKIDYLVERTFSGLTKLEEINLTGNCLTKLHTNTFKNLPKIKSIIITANQLETLDRNIFANIASLESIYLTCNKLTNLHPSAFTGLRSLTALSLANNKLSILSTHLFNGLFNLTFLSLSGNQLKRLDPLIFVDLVNLENFYCRNNLISFLAPNLFVNLGKLKRLNLAYNQIRFLHGELFSRTTNLNSVDFGKNQIDDIGEDLFKTLEHLEYVNLSNNKILRLHKNDFYNFANITLDISGNIKLKIL